MSALGQRAAASVTHPLSRALFALTFTTGLAADSRLAGGDGKGSTRRVLAVVAMLAGALGGALLLKSSLTLPLIAAAGLALATWLVCVPAARREAGAREPDAGS